MVETSNAGLYQKSNDVATEHVTLQHIVTRLMVAALHLALGMCVKAHDVALKVCISPVQRWEEEVV